MPGNTCTTRPIQHPTLHYMRIQSYMTTPARHADNSLPIKEQAKAWDAVATICRPAGLRRDVYEWQVHSTAAGAPPPPSTDSSQASQAQGSTISIAAHSAQTGDTPPDQGTAAAGTQSREEQGARRVRVSHVDATRLLASCFLEEDYYDVIDIDSFGR